SDWNYRASGFGFRISFGFRHSSFGFLDPHYSSPVTHHSSRLSPSVFFLIQSALQFGRKPNLRCRTLLTTNQGKLMKIRYVLALTSVVLTSLTHSLRADVVTDWNSAALNAIRIDKTPPPKSSRALAIFHVAIY